MEIRILLVEDDPVICGMTEKYLLRDGYVVDACECGEIALNFIYERHYDLIILDIMLPGLSGQEILSELRKIHDTPVLMMTALSDDASQLTAFDHEADDYVTKPFSMEVLMKRTRALLKRSGALQEEIRVGRLTLYPETCGVSWDDAFTPLTPKEFDILKLLAMNRRRIIKHEVMLIRIWGYDFDGNEGIIHASMKKLRDKLPRGLIKTVKGVGYMLEVKECEA